MLPRSSRFGVVLLAFAAGGAARGDDLPEFARTPLAARSGEPVLAFNGRDLTGFYVFTKPHGFADPNGVFTVQDGAIRVSGQDWGGFATGGNFRDYHLVVEWRWGEKTWAERADRARDSGVLVHCVGPDGAHGETWMESVEVQVIEGGTGDLILVGGRNRPSLTCETRTDSTDALYYQKGGMPVTRDTGRFNWWGRDPAWTDTLGFRGVRDVENPLGEWNRMDVVCDGGAITCHLNGLLVNAGTNSSHSEGKIQFQSEGAEIFFRKIEVRPLVRE